MAKVYTFDTPLRLYCYLYIFNLIYTAEYSISHFRNQAKWHTVSTCVLFFLINQYQRMRKKHHEKKFAKFRKNDLKKYDLSVLLANKMQLDAKLFLYQTYTFEFRLQL